MKKIILPLLFLVLIITSCSKQQINEKKLGGIWEAKKVSYLFYQNNELIKDSTVDNTGALYLYDDDELDNQFRYSMSIIPASFNSAQSWEGNSGKPQTLLGMNIRKLSRKKLELSENRVDTSYNVLKTVVFYFERQ